MKRQLVLMMLAVFMLPVWATPSKGSYYFEQVNNFDAYNMGNGKVHVKVLVFADGKDNNYNAGLGQNHSANQSSYGTLPTQLGTPNPRTGSRVWTKTGSNPAEFILYYSGDNHFCKAGASSDPRDMGTVWFKVMDGIAVVTNTYNGVNKVCPAREIVYMAEVRRPDSGDHLTYLEFDWYPSAVYDEVEYILGVTSDHHKSGGSEFSSTEFTLGTFTGAATDIAPILSEAFPAMGNKLGKDVTGKMAVSYTTMQKTHRYYTSLDETEYACTDQSGMLYVDMRDTVITGFRACFQTTRSSDETTKQWLWSNRVNIQAYHAIHEMTNEVYHYSRGGKYYKDERYKQISWKIYYPEATDAVEGDMFELQRAYRSDFSDAETLTVFPMAYDSTAVVEEDGIAKQKYTYVDSVQAAWWNPVEMNYRIYYRVRRVSAAGWGWNGHAYAASMQTSDPSYEYKQAGLNEMKANLDADFETNHRVNIALKLSNLNFGIDRSERYPGYTHTCWTDNAKLYIRKVLTELNDTIDIQIPTEYIQHYIDSVFYHPEKKVFYEGMIIIPYTDIVSTPCVHYRYSAYIDTTGIGIDKLEGTLYQEGVDDRHDTLEAYYDEMAGIAEFTASQEEYPDYVLLTWHPTDGKVGYYTLEGRPQGTSAYRLIKDSIEEAWYRDYAAWPEENWNWEYRLTLHYFCQGEEATTSATATGSRFHYGTISGRVAYEDGLGCPGITVSATNTATGETVRTAETDETGAYVLDSLPYLHGTEYVIQPTSQSAEFRYNHTSSGFATIRIASDNNIIRNIDFENISCVRFSGRVLYENTTIPVRDAQFLLNGKTVRLSSKPYKTDAAGNFEFMVPRGTAFTIQAYKEGHRFAGEGYVRIEGSEQLTLTQPLDGIRIYDQTKVRLTGRLTGGQNQADKPLGFGLSRNNLGDDLQMVLELEGDNISQIVHIPSDLTIEQIDTVMPHLVAADESSLPDTVGHTSVQYLRKRIIIRPDITTGEYAVDLYPVKYKITQATARGYSTLYEDGKSSETLDLTNAPLTEREIAHEGKKMHTNEIYSIIYHSPIDISCRQLRYGTELPYYGEERIIRQNIANEQVETPLVETGADKSYHYLFGVPVFGMDNYTFRAAAHEDYYYNNDPTSPLHEEVRIKNGVLKVYNGMHDADNTQIQTMSLDENGEAVFTIPVDYVSFMKTGESALRVLDLSVEYQGAHIEKQVLRAYIMGNKTKGMDFLTSTTGDIVLLDVLRDPPGSGSSAYLEAGTTYKYNYTWDVKFKFGLDIFLGYGTNTNLTMGTFAGMGAGLYAGYETHINTMNSVSLPIQSSYYHKHSASYTFSLSEKVETGSDVYSVGEDADIYLGAVQNVYYGLTDAVKPIDSLTYAALSTQFANGTMRVVQSGRDSQGKLWYLAIGQETEVGTYMSSSFVYTHMYIKETLLPKLKRERDALLLSGDSVTVQAIADAQHKAVYWTKVAPGDDNFASENYYRQLTPTGSGKIYDDEVAAYNRQIAGWVHIMVQNEAEKINAIHGGKSKKVGQWSVSGGAKMSHSESYEYSNTYTTKVDYPGASIKMGQGIIATLVNAFGNTVANKIDKAAASTVDDNGDALHPFELATQVPGAAWKFDLTPILDVDFAYDPSHGTTNTKKTGFTLHPDAYGYMDVSVYRVEDKKNKFYAEAEETVDFTDAEKDGYRYGSYVYYTNGGASRCPWESAQYTQYYEPQVKLSEGTLQLENQKLDIDVHERNNVPADQPAIFNLRMTNEGEHELGMGTGPITFYLKQDEGSNPKGAKLMMDGMPLTGDGRAIKLKHGQILNKTLEVYAGEGYDFEDIMLNLASPCDMYSSAKCTFSVHFMPVSCNVNLSMPRDNWTMNTLSAQDSVGWYLPVVIDGFDVNYKGFDHIEFQYKLATQSEDAWVNLCSYYADDSLYEAASGTKELITGGRIENIRFYGERDPMEQRYDLRAVSFCRHGNGFITRASEVRRGTKDTRPPRVFGDPQPVDAILGVGDNLLLRFNEAIAGNYLDADNNFQILGTVNNLGMTAGTSVHFDGTEDSYAMTQVKRDLTDKSFTVDLIVKPNSPNQEEVFFMHGTDGSAMSFGKTADNRLYLDLSFGRILSQPIEPITDFTRVAVTYNYDDSSVRFYAGTKDVTNYALQVPLFYYVQDAPLIFGKGFAGSMMEARVWTKALSAAEIAQTHMKRMTGYEFKLLAYYPMNEGRGKTLADKANGATMTLSGATWNIAEGASIHFTEGSETLRLNSDVLSRSAIQDVTLMFWFKTGYHFGRLFSAGREEPAAGSQSAPVGTWIGIERGALILKSDSSEWMIGNYSNNEWHHFVLSVNRTFNNASIFIDGNMTNTFAATELGGISGTMFLGGEYVGNIDHLIFFEQAMPKTIVSAYDNLSPHGDEMGLMAYLPFSERKENENGIMETVFSPNDQRIITDPEGKVVSKTIPLIQGLEHYLDGTDLGSPALLFDKTDHAPVREHEHLTKLNFDWSFNDDELLININMPTKEINKQMVYITVRDVEDINGNPMASPVMWAAFVDKNSLKWMDNEIEIVVSDTQQDDWAYIATPINNNSGMYHQYIVEALPYWLTTDEPTGAMDPQETKSLSFKYKLGMPIGKYSEIIYLTDENGLSDPIKVTYTVEAEPPVYEIDKNKYPLNMSVCGQVLLNTKEGSVLYDTDERDIVYAMYRNQCVGMAHIAFNAAANTSDLYLTVHGSDDMARKAIRFQLWQASTGKVYNLSLDREILFAHGFVYGCGDDDPVQMTTGGSEVVSINLPAGWSWISVPLDMQATGNDLNTSLTAAYPWSNNDLIKNPYTRQFSSYSEASDAFVGTLTKLHHSQMYMVHTAGVNIMRVTGDQLHKDSMRITVRGDGQWSPLPCFYTQVIPINEALSDYYDKAVAGDLIKAHDRFATMSKNGKWVGDLTALHPGEGYLFRRMAPGSAEITFYRYNFSQHHAPKRMPYAPEAGYRNPDAATNMTMIAKVQGDNAQHTKVYVYVGDELTGVAALTDSLYFLTIQSDKTGALRFVTEDGMVLSPLSGSMNYIPDSHLGSLEAPVLLSPASHCGKAGVYKILENDQVVIIRNEEKYSIMGTKIE